MTTRNNNASTDETISLMLLGDSGTGKTAFIRRLIDNDFTVSSETTMMHEISKYQFNDVNQKRIIIDLWDIPGTLFANTSYQNPNNPVSLVINKAAPRVDGFVVVFDTADESTFQNLKKYIDFGQSLGSQLICHCYLLAINVI